MKHAVLINPASGRRHGERVGAEAAAALISAGHDVETIQGSSAADARDRLKTALDAGLDGVLVVGGDGALHDVLEVLAAADVTVGIIPAGTGNDTARALGLPVKDTRRAVEIVLAGRTRTIDLARADETYLASVVASGFDSKVNERANAMAWPKGNMRYNRAILQELRVFSPLPFEIDLDGVRIEREAMLVAVGNGPSFGGGLRITEGADLEDGLLDVVIINPVSKLELLKVFPTLYRGTHVNHPAYEHHLVRSVRLSSPGIVAYADGERLGPLPTTVTVVPRALRVFVP